MDDLIILLVRGIGSGSVYALVALSLNVIYNATGVLNFSQGMLLVLGGVLTFYWMPSSTSTGAITWLMMMVLVAIITALVAGIQGWLTLLPMRSASDHHSWIVSTIAASIILGSIITLVVGHHDLHVQNHLGTIGVRGSQIPSVYFALFGLTFVVYFAIRIFQRRFLTGLALSALSQDVDAARVAGVRTGLLQVLAFAIGGLVVGTAAYIGGPVLGINEGNALNLVIFGFIVAVIGGIGNNTGALIGGPIFGIVLMMATFRWGGGAQVPIGLAAIIGILMVRPQGLFGRPHARRV